MSKEQQNGIQKIFAEVPEKYELTNHILTFGLDILWRKKAAKLAATHGGTKWMDVCSGTGETAVYLSQLAPAGTSVTALDFSPEMLEELKKKEKKIEICNASVEKIPFLDNTFDLITISFAARNINTSKEDFIKRLAEIYRVLKPGGMFMCLETSQPTSRLLRFLFHLYIRLAVAPIGTLISKSKKAYKYLSHTMPRFYGAEEFSSIIKESGFDSIKFCRMMFGAAAIHRAWKTK